MGWGWGPFTPCSRPTHSPSPMMPKAKQGLKVAFRDAHACLPHSRACQLALAELPNGSGTSLRVLPAQVQVRLHVARLCGVPRSALESCSPCRVRVWSRAQVSLVRAHCCRRHRRRSDASWRRRPTWDGTHSRHKQLRSSSLQLCRRTRTTFGRESSMRMVSAPTWWLHEPTFGAGTERCILHSGTTTSSSVLGNRVTSTLTWSSAGMQTRWPMGMPWSAHSSERCASRSPLHTLVATCPSAPSRTSSRRRQGSSAGTSS